MPRLVPVTDPALLAELNAEAQAPTAPAGPVMAADLPEHAGLADPRFRGRGPHKTLAGEAARTAVQVGGPSVLPAAGAAVGAMAPFPVNLMAAPAGAMLGEVGNRVAGITGGDLDETALRVGMAGASTAAVPPGVGVAGKAGASAATGTRAGRFLGQELAVAKAEAIPGARVAIPTPADDLFALARQTNPQVEIAPFTQALGDFRHRQGLRVASGQQAGPLRMADEIEALVQTRAGGGPANTIDLQALFENTKAAGQKLREARAAGSADAEGYAVIYKAGREALEAAAKKSAGAGQTVSALDAAMSAFRREAIRDDLTEFVAQAIPKPRTGDPVIQGSPARQVNIGRLYEALTSKKDQYRQFQADLAKALTPAEVAAIKADVLDVLQTKPLPAVAGAEKGAGRGLARMVGGAAVGEGLGQAVGAPTGTGALVGAAGADRVAELVSESLLNGRARPLLLRILKSKIAHAPAGSAVVLSQPEIAILTAAVTAQLPTRLGGARMEP